MKILANNGAAYGANKITISTDVTADWVERGSIEYKVREHGGIITSVEIPITDQAAWTPTSFPGGYYKFINDTPFPKVISYIGGGGNGFGLGTPFQIFEAGTYRFISSTTSVWVTGPGVAGGGDYTSWINIDLDDNYGGRDKTVILLAGSGYVQARQSQNGTVTITKIA